MGRKSTNNLNLTCQWGNCRTTTVKRDHITSHIRVHVPLKPHKCDFCGKAFKRPQDLKKHVKTHADDSVLLRSPEPSRGGHGGPGGPYQNQGTKLVADLQSLAATASGYYPDHHQVSGQPMYYPNASGNSAAYHGASAPQQGSAYGPVYYAVSQTPNEKAEYELRKRAAFDALNEFFGDAKRRSIDPNSYYDVGQRLSSLQSLTLPTPGGFGGGGGDYHSGGTAVATAQGPLLQPQYSLPLSNLRTKNDLLQIDQFLDQLQQTVYENSNSAAAAGVAQAGAHYVPASVNYRTSNSPPHIGATSHPQSSHATAVASMASTSAETPALTPASSVLSYQSAHSPSSVHSGQTISPVQRASVNSMYPTLPAVSAMSDSNLYASTGGAPPAGLATAFDADGRRRYSGGLLQKAASSGDSDETPSPTISRAGSNPVRSPGSGMLDPALRSPGVRSEASDSEADKNSAQWVENIRIIEALRLFIKEKIESGDYADEDGVESVGDPMDTEMETERQREAESLYPVLREVQGEA